MKNDENVKNIETKNFELNNNEMVDVDLVLGIDFIVDLRRTII